MMVFHFDYTDLKRIVIEAVLLVCLGISVGLMFNFQLVKSAFEGEIVVTAGDAENGSEAFPVPVSLADVQELMARSVLIDARIPELYAEGHLPGAVSLPLSEVDDKLDEFRKSFPERSLIIYCSGYGCSDSFDLALRLIDTGYHDVMVYEGGFPEWRDAGQPVAGGAP